MTAEKKNTLQIMTTIVVVSGALLSGIIWTGVRVGKVSVLLYRVEKTMTDFEQEKAATAAFKTQTEKNFIELRNENILFRDKLLKEIKP